MSRRTEDPLVAEIRHALMPGRFVKWDAVSGLVDNLDQVHTRVERSVKAVEAARAVRLYEVFLTGVYAKIEEADDEGDLANLFHRLICGWIQARQAAGQPFEETVSQLLNWMKNDDYGFCHDSLCVKAKEWERLAQLVHSDTAEELESLSHYCTEPAAKVLAKKDALAAAKLYRGLALRVVNTGKSNYYREALGHFENARDLYHAAGHAAEWQSLVRTVRVVHSRKSGFLSAFERIVSDKSHSSS